MPSTLESPTIRPLIDTAALAERIDALAAQISKDYAGLNPIFVCTLKGSMPFFVDLTRRMEIPLRYDYIAVQSYEGTKSSGVVKFTADLSLSIEGQHVIMVEDIVDTGLTMGHLFELLGARKPASLSLVTLLDKSMHRTVDVDIKYCGFEIGDEFVVGYGLDYQQYFRNLPYVGVLEEIPEGV